MKQLNVCPSLLAANHHTFSPLALRQLFNGRKVSPFVDFSYDADNMNIAEAINKISISGVQEKLSATIDKGKIVIPPAGSQGRYIIKLSPDYKHLRYREQIPANEHLTMQIAKQVYGINTAHNAIIFFADGKPAYLTKRFDFAANGEKIKQEDFCSLAQKTALNSGANYKYTGSYEQLALLLKQYVSSWRIEINKLFKLIVFNYLFANGDAHLKNFSVQQTVSGDYVLSPAYDLMNTSIHVNDEDFALAGKLFAEEHHSDIYIQTGHPCIDDFALFADRIGLIPSQRDKILSLFSSQHDMVFQLIESSFLDERTKRMYSRSYNERLSRFLRRNK